MEVKINMKKVILRLSMLVISIGLLTACGKDDGEKTMFITGVSTLIWT